MKINSKILTVAVFVFIFGGILFSSALGWWNTENVKEPARFDVGDAAGEYNPADIRGSYNFGEISNLFDIPLEDLRTAFRVPEGTDAAAFELKSLEELYVDLPEEIGTSSVRLFVALYKGLPYDLSDNSFLLPEAVMILQNQGALTEEQETYLATHTVSMPMSQEAQSQEAASGDEAVVATSAPEAEVEVTEHDAAEQKVTGETIFQDLLDWGVEQSVIETILGNDMPDADVLVKDYCQQNGLAFSTIKSSLQSELDN